MDTGECVLKHASYSATPTHKIFLWIKNILIDCNKMKAFQNIIQWLENSYSLTENISYTVRRSFPIYSSGNLIGCGKHRSSCLQGTVLIFIPLCCHSDFRCSWIKGRGKFLVKRGLVKRRVVIFIIKYFMFQIS